MNLRVFGLAEDSIVDGPGLRFTVFTQGCPHGCPGCHNPGSHAMDAGQKMDTERLARQMLENPLQSGLTLSGGEPFAQAAACADLARRVKARGKSVWTYTGYTLEALQAAQDPGIEALLAASDILVDGLYLQAQRSLALRFRGSANQRIICLRETLAAGQITLWTPEDPLPLPFRRGA
jgi:anaerobic ribonucleoside-triphosphate reductase activating protein